MPWLKVLQVCLCFKFFSSLLVLTCLSFVIHTDKGLKVNKLKSKIPWDLTSIFSEHLNDDSDGEDGDEVEAYEASKKRLKVRSIAVSPLLVLTLLYKTASGRQNSSNDKGTIYLLYRLSTSFIYLS